MNQPTTTMITATPRNAIAFGSTGHWPGSLGFSPRNWEAAPSKTEFRSTLTDLGLLAMATSGALGRRGRGCRRDCRQRLLRCSRHRLLHTCRKGSRCRPGRVLRALHGQPHREIEQALLLAIRRLHGRGLALDQLRTHEPLGVVGGVAQ